MALSWIVFWNGMIILWTFKNIYLIPIYSDYIGTHIWIEGMSILNFETMVAKMVQMPFLSK